jgi:class II lanthipeptide synthase
VYGLVVIGWLLDEPTLLEDAARVAARITDSRITAEESPDTLVGSAGAILAFDVLHAATGSCEWIDRANACGQHVLARLESGPSTARAWRTYNGRCLTGLSHGAAGISYALLRLAALTGDRSYVEAAREGIAYEAEVFSPSERNWPDFRAEEPAYPVQWCHGAPGIALSRIGGLPALDTPAIRREIDLALATTEAAAVDDIDHVCCGTMGRVETLMVAADRYGRSDLRPRALQQTAQVLARANRRGGFALHPLLPAAVPNPTFFQGTAGIGYTLLRLAAPGQLPSILLWERPPA